MALFCGGPADGWRLDVEPGIQRVGIPLNPNPPGFTPDLSVLNPEILPVAYYKYECIITDVEKYCVYIPEDWTEDDLIQALILNYRKDNKEARLNYLNHAKGIIYDNDDRNFNGRPYSS